ncbi:MAG: excinuclease ABC subunit UvrC [Lachnospiraceae bacterium]|nr:excinuclease ABC subunit UvrC [Lachnospiraceae bacterium]MBQ3973331.1 excinuclease ABC subunit UvrC [Lachnospiraceae bacterium]MBQ4305151.1 excinuclease ABC subunit UvrC [Lachnospiraceae bacterium]MBQ5359583.1 excinuclease ABC subunit UvrC [Lachnospiraceae bacterium]
MFDIQEELKKLPPKPGVYIMHDDKDAIIYVGKAVNLHNRVRSYFRKIVGRGPQIDQMVRQIARFEYIVTDSELEALVLENNLIKEHMPKYNTMLRDDKTYPYIKVTVQEDFPRILFSRQIKKDKARYFGPFTSGLAVRETIELLNRIYGLRDCSRSLPRDTGKERPCLNYHMQRCCGPCTGEISREEYRKRSDAALEFLSGNYGPVVRDLTDQMNKASEEMRFEDAVRFRDLLQSVKSVSQKQKMSDAPGENRDIIGAAVEKENADADGVIQTFFIRDGRLIGREHFYMAHVGGKTEAELMADFIQQFYAGTPFIPKEIMLPEEPVGRELLEEWLTLRKGSKVSLVIPRKGQKSRLVDLAVENAALILSKDRERMKREEGRTIGAVRELEELLGLSSCQRMEAYDISNISGFANVGSMIVYEKGKPKRSDYRKFRIKTVAGPNDYACMKEVLTRRFTHGMEEQKELEEKNLDRALGSFTRFPDLLMMDGGRGQVNIALEVLGELGLSIPVCGMVKDDNHRTRGLYYNNIEIPIDRHSEAFKLITRVQDEAHRFAIEYHRSLRSKSQVTSRLDEIPGVGPVRKKALMKQFASIQEIMEADEETLASVPGISGKQAQEIWNYFHRET